MTMEASGVERQPGVERVGACYVLEGTLLEACNCNVLCPCWIGEDPDNGTCDSVIAYHIDRGHIQGVEVAGLTVLEAQHIPGNVLAGNWRQVILVDDRASHDQIRLLADAFQGRLGGPLADLAGLVGERLGAFAAPINHQLVGGEGTLIVGDKVRAATAPVPQCVRHDDHTARQHLQYHSWLARLGRKSERNDGESARTWTRMEFHQHERDPGRFQVRTLKHDVAS